MWEAVAREVAARGGEVHLQHRVVGIERSGLTVTAVTVRDESTGAVRRVACDYFLSTLPVRDLAAMLLPEDERVAHVAREAPLPRFHDGRALAAQNVGAGQESAGRCR